MKLGKSATNVDRCVRYVVHGLYKRYLYEILTKIRA